MNKNYSQRDIARSLNRSNSSISEEIKNGSVRGVYDPAKASHKAYVRRHNSKYQAMKIVENPELKSFVEKSLYDGQYVGNIAGRVSKKENHLPKIGKDSIYRFIKSIYGRKIENFIKDPSPFNHPKTYSSHNLVLLSRHLNM